ncbi:hypothetical protein J31TS4_31990 [Paenibacillus sp. J31TS4]|nr:hypothetical protein J31TS4_31990 [Paenibacillus sp. J31TS4]
MGRRLRDEWPPAPLRARFLDGICIRKVETGSQKSLLRLIRPSAAGIEEGFAYGEASCRLEATCESKLRRFNAGISSIF